MEKREIELYMSCIYVLVIRYIYFSLNLEPSFQCKSVAKKESVDNCQK